LGRSNAAHSALPCRGAQHRGPEGSGNYRHYRQLQPQPAADRVRLVQHGGVHRRTGRHGRVYVINKKNPRMKARQG
jgi:hypothetical protein